MVFSAFMAVVSVVSLVGDLLSAGASEESEPPQAVNPMVNVMESIEA